MRLAMGLSNTNRRSGFDQNAVARMEAFRQRIAEQQELAATCICEPGTMEDACALHGIEEKNMPIEITTPFPPEETTHFLSLGAGVQSTVLYLMACAGEVLPTPRAAIFADTQWEPSGIYEHLKWLESLELRVPIIRVSAGDIFTNTWNATRVAENNRRNPFTEIPTFAEKPTGERSIRPRQCTSNYKIQPILREIRSILERVPRTRHHKPPFACQWLGISTDEWHRAKDARDRWVHNAHPLLDANMSRTDCLAYFKERYPDQPLNKSSCVGCPFHSDRDWLRLYREEPAAVQQAIDLDLHLRTTGRMALERKGWPQYLHRRGPLGEVLRKLDEQDRMQIQLLDDDAWGNECEGHCNT